MNDVRQVSFQLFKAKFRELITSPRFGDLRRSDPNSESAARKELRRRTELLDMLESGEFCHRVYRLSEECQRLESERVKVPQVARRMRPAIHRYRDATRRLESCARRLAEFDEKYRGLVDPRVWQKIGSAVALIEGVADELGRRRKVLVSNVHPKHRTGKDDECEWELLFKEYNYDLEKLGVKATDQWFWSNVNDALIESVKQHKAGRLSAMTRVKVIAAISEAAGRGRVQPAAIKQFFFEHASPKT
jgi:hypothetical protein